MRQSSPHIGVLLAGVLDAEGDRLLEGVVGAADLEDRADVEGDDGRSVAAVQHIGQCVAQGGTHLGSEEGLKVDVDREGEVLLALGHDHQGLLGDAIGNTDGVEVDGIVHPLDGGDTSLVGVIDTDMRREAQRELGILITNGVDALLGETGVAGDTADVVDGEAGKVEVGDVGIGVGAVLEGKGLGDAASA